VEGERLVIPKLFHRIWLKQDDDDVIPPEFEAYWRKLKKLHLGWEFRTWSDPNELGWMRCKEVFDRATTHAGRSDVLRFELMFAYGGVYVDTDVEPLRPFDDLLEDDRPFAAWENDKLICPTVLGGPARHPAYEAVLEMLPRWSLKFPGHRPNLQTGPVPLTMTWKRRRDVRLLPSVAFYPVGWWERDNLGGPYPAESYCVHHWTQRWDPAGKARIDERQAGRKAAV
jgi:mannosyltransferase OCH1-like enzyme